MENYGREFKKYILNEVLDEARPKGDLYSLSFEARKSLGNYDRMIKIKEKNLIWSRVKYLINKYNPLGLGGSGWYIRGSVFIKNETTNKSKNISPFKIQDNQKFNDLE